MPVDFFFRSLAEDMKTNAIGVVLSGGDHDGVIGLGQIRAEGGVCMVQDPSTAKIDSMPKNAIADGNVDFVLSPDQLAAELMRISDHPIIKAEKTMAGEEFLPAGEPELLRIYTLLRNATRADFSQYKTPTIQRRIKRRMLLHKVGSLREYVKYLEADPQEVQALYQDLLINVTNFFRDPESFAALKEKVFPQLLKKRPPGNPLRIWVAGCSTGEEAYSVAICLIDAMMELSLDFPLQIFATDLSEQAIERARSGIYSDAIVADVSPELLRRFFVKSGSGYTVNRSIRDVCIFAAHDVTRDPPFSRVDLICCRNLLIYLNSPLQKRVMTTFHYALAPRGYLMLGSSESIGSSAEHFSLIDKKNKIFIRKTGHSHLAPAILGSVPLHLARTSAVFKSSAAQRGSVDLQREIDRVLLEKISPVGVLVDEAFNIVQFRGDTSPFLRAAPGTASLNVVRMASDGVALELRALLAKAVKTRQPVTQERLTLKKAGVAIQFDLEVAPVEVAEAHHYLVLFKNVGGGERKLKASKKEKPSRRNVAANTVRLEQELAANREYLQSIIQDIETANEELQSANEEILSSNEELQSTNEELETAKEELQSSNEELTTVNEELSNRIFELTQVNNDLTNLLASVNLPIIMVGNDLRLRRFTPMAEKLFNLIASDIGRPITDIKPKIDVPGLDKLIIETIETFTTQERTVRDNEGRSYLLRVRPYRTSDNRIDGAIIILLDVEGAKT